MSLQDNTITAAAAGAAISTLGPWGTVNNNQVTNDFRITNIITPDGKNLEPPDTSPKVDGTPGMHKYILETLYESGRMVNHTSFDELSRPEWNHDDRRAATESVISWAESSSANAIFWLSGYTGAGTSTVAYFVAEHLKRHNRLAASYFVSRSRPESQCAKSIIPTLAYRLAVMLGAHAAVGESLMKALADKTIFKKEFTVQWEELIITPLRLFEGARMVIVVDGLDDCNNEKDQMAILTVILKAAKESSTPVKVVISCKHKQRNLDNFELPAECKAVLGDSSRDRSEIRTFLQKSLMKILNLALSDGFTRWEPDIEPLVPFASQELADAASGQFLLAKAMVDYVSKGGSSSDPVDRIHDLMADPFRVVEDIESTYAFFLKRVFAEIDAEDHGAIHLLIIHLVLHHHHHLRPLRLSDFARFWTDDNCVLARRALGPLRPELILPEPLDNDGIIRFRHGSFARYLSGLYSIFIDPPRVNATHSSPIASRCLQILQKLHGTCTNSQREDSESRLLRFVVTHSLEYCRCSIPTVDIIHLLGMVSKRVSWTPQDAGYFNFITWLEDQRFLGWLSAQFRPQASSGLVEQARWLSQRAMFIMIGQWYYGILELGHASEYTRGVAESLPQWPDSVSVYPHPDRDTRMVRLSQYIPASYREFLLSSQDSQGPICSDGGEKSGLWARALVA